MERGGGGRRREVREITDRKEDRMGREQEGRKKNERKSKSRKEK